MNSVDKCEAMRRECLDIAEKLSSSPAEETSPLEDTHTWVARTEADAGRGGMTAEIGWEALRRLRERVDVERRLLEWVARMGDELGNREEW
jgi:hypothetical protein